MISKSDLEVLGELRHAIDRAAASLSEKLVKGHARICLFLPDTPAYQFVFKMSDVVKRILDVEDIYKVESLGEPLIGYATLVFVPIDSQGRVKCV